MTSTKTSAPSGSGSASRSVRTKRTPSGSSRSVRPPTLTSQPSRISRSAIARPIWPVPPRMNAVRATISPDIIDIVSEPRRVGFGVEETAPLFARIPKAEAENLTRTARALGTSKQRLLTTLLAEHLEPLALGAHEFRPTVASADVLTLDEAAELLRVEPRTLRALAARGEAPGRKIGREWRFSRQGLLDWLAHAAAASGTRPRV